VEAFAMALSDRSGYTDFYLRGVRSGIVYEKDARRIRVNTTTIERFLRRRKMQTIDMINMDCEGSEFLVLKGAEKSLRKNDVRIFCELHHVLLRQLGQSTDRIIAYL
jgi:FkbM family methyltransferase